MAHDYRLIADETRPDALERLEESYIEEPTGLWNVYFLSLVDPATPHRDFGLVKVGITKNDVERRIEELQTGNPYQLRCERSFLTPAPVARRVENWVHRTHASRVAHLEWLRLTRPEIQELFEAARQEAERFAHIAEAEERWSQSKSRKKERPASTEETQLHEAIRDVLSQLCPLELRLKHTEARIALNAGKVLRVPGVVRIRLVPPSRRFNSQIALEKFPYLAAEHTVEVVGGRFRWQQVPTLGSPELTELRQKVEDLEKQQRELDHVMLGSPNELRDEGERTDDLARLHEEYLVLKQKEARLEVDKEDLQAQMIERMEDFEAITDVCSFRRSPKGSLNKKSFREAHPSEAADCFSESGAYVGRKIFLSRSY